MQNKRILRFAIATGLILLIPLIAMQFTDEVKWTLFDFVVAGILLFGSGLTYELIARRGSNTMYKAAVAVAVATGLLLIWLNLAVGLIGSEDNPANALYLGVFIVGLIGAALSGLAPRGMSRALFATAFAQFLVPVVAIMIWKSEFTIEETSGVVGVLLLNGFFAALFVVSAILFRRSAATTALKL